MSHEMFLLAVLCWNSCCLLVTIICLISVVRSGRRIRSSLLRCQEAERRCQHLVAVNPV